MYCFQCGARTAEQQMDGRIRPVCPACGRVHYFQLKVGAGVLLEHQGRLLLVQRGPEASAFGGTWSLPAGYCEADESPRVTAAREAQEETGLTVIVGRLVDASFFDDDPRGNGVLLVYEAETQGTGFEHGPSVEPASSEVEAIGFFPADDLPYPLCGGGHDRAIRAWQKRAIDRWEPGIPLRYCPHCTHLLQERMAFGRLRRICPRCGFVHFRQPKVGVALLVEHEGHVLLVRRAVPPQEGMWSLPSGFVEWDEAPEEAAARECLEETGLKLGSLELLDVVQYTADPRGPGISLLFRGKVIAGELRPGDDAESAQFFAVEELPPLESIAFQGHREVLERWQVTAAHRS